jgi:hypothetical protein
MNNSNLLELCLDDFMKRFSEKSEMLLNFAARNNKIFVYTIAEFNMSKLEREITSIGFSESLVTLLGTNFA